MTVAEITKKMVGSCNGNHHDISHFLKVYAYAKTIGECEGLSERDQKTLEIAAVLHDIACPLCREKYGHVKGSYQEMEGMPLTRAFLQDAQLEEEIVERVVYLVGHHHTLQGVDGLDYQILLEADYLVNANECGFTTERIQQTMETLFKTETGREMLQSVYLAEANESV